MAEFSVFVRAVDSPAFTEDRLVALLGLRRVGQAYRDLHERSEFFIFIDVRDGHGPVCGPVVEMRGSEPRPPETDEPYDADLSIDLVESPSDDELGRRNILALYCDALAARLTRARVGFEMVTVTDRFDLCRYHRNSYPDAMFNEL